MKLNYQSAVTVLGIGIAVFMFIDGCNRKEKMYQQSVEIANYNDTVMSYKDKNGKMIAYNKALQLDKDVAYDMVAGLEEEIKDLKLKKPEVIVKYRNKVQIDSIEIEHDIPCEEFAKNFIVDSTHYIIRGTLTDKSLLFRDITIPNEQTFVVAHKRPKWYKSKEYVIVTKNSNPYVMSEGLQSYTIKPTQKFYQKWYFHVGVGLLGGLLLDNAVR
jgi:hypothetical protein